MRTFLTALLIFFLATLQVWAAEPDPGLRPSEEGLRPIDISPIPEKFLPFQKPKESLQYFPDEVEKNVEGAIISGYKGQDWAIDDYYRFLLRKDLELIKSGQEPTGLADEMLQFRNSHIYNPLEYREAQQRALQQKGLSEDLRKVITYRLKNAELAKAERLLHESELTKVGMVVNGFLRSLDLVGITMGSVVGSTVDAAVHTFLNLEEVRKMSPKEKKALAEYQAYLAKHPDAPDAEQVRTEVERLEAKRKRWAFQEVMDEGSERLKVHDYTEAQAAYARALELEPGSTEALEGLKKVDELRAAYEAAMDRSLEITKGEKGPQDRVEEAAYRWLLASVAVGDNEGVQRRAEEFAGRFPDSPLRDEALYARASALAALGHHQEAKDLLEKIAQEYRGENMGERAQLVLSSQEFDRLGKFQEAKFEHTKKQVQYALLGEDFARQNIDMAVSRIVIEGIKSVETLGMVNLLGAGIRSVEMVSNDPISNEPIIEEGLKFARSHPDAPELNEVYYQIASAYEREKRYIDALTYYQLSGKASGKKISSLRQKAARGLLGQATMVSDSEMKARLYSAIIEHFPETDSAGKAKERFVEVAKQYQDRFRLSREYLLEHPDLVGPRGLNLDPKLLDGDLTNLELNSKGMVLLQGNRMRAFFTMPDGSEASRVYRVNPDMVARMEGELREVGRKRAYDLSARYDLEGPVALAQEAFVGTVAEEKRYNPFIVQEINELTGNVYLSEEELKEYEETLYANLNADISPNLGDYSTGGSLYFRRYGAGLHLGIDRESPNVGAMVPLGLININTKMRATGFSVYPSIRLDDKPLPDAELYK